MMNYKFVYGEDCNDYFTLGIGVGLSKVTALLQEYKIGCGKNETDEITWIAFLQARNIEVNQAQIEEVFEF